MTNINCCVIISTEVRTELITSALFLFSNIIEGVFDLKFKTGDEARVKRTNKETMYKHIEGTTVLVLNNVCGDLYKVCDCIGGQWVLDEEMLEPVDSKTLYTADGTIIGEFKGIPVYATGGTVSIHDLPTSEWYNPHIDLVFDQVKAKELAEQIAQILDKSMDISKTIKEEKKMPTKFTFYVKEGTRPDKKCNGTIPTITTNIELFDGNVFDKVTTIRGSATCDRADYDERQGVLEALANAVCGGEFEKRYSKAVKANKDADLIMRTCTYCGKVCDTSEEKIEHEKWHVERKKARRERYLLRKRAKEIAFEEQAQKMAKEMIDAEKGDK